MFILSANLNGIILEKAEMEENFSVFYSKVFERMEELEDSEQDFLRLLGEVGG
jgi:hypothetical protein